MRVPTTTAIVLTAALLAACSTSSQGTLTLPSRSNAGAAGVGAPEFPHGPMGYEQMLKWFIAGKMTRPASKTTLEKWLKDYGDREVFHPRVSRAAGKIAAWVNVSPNYLLGETNFFKKTVMVINTNPGKASDTAGCYNSAGLKIDHNANVLLSCGETQNPSTGTAYDVGGAQEYSSTGALVAQYNGGCANNIPGCVSATGYGVDAATDTSGNVYVADEYYDACGSDSCSDETGFQIWTSPSSSVFASVNGAAEGYNVYSVGYFDVDSAGNIWTSFYGVELLPHIAGMGIAEVTGATSGSPTFTVVVPPGTLPGTMVTDNAGFPGIYVAGTTATVIDPFNQTVYQYSLPITPSSTPSTLGTTQKSISGCGDPIEGGWNEPSTRFAIGDGCGWVDTLTSSGKATAHVHKNFNGIKAAAYTPSNK
jgi:hypothetical protein